MSVKQFAAAAAVAFAVFSAGAASAAILTSVDPTVLPGNPYGNQAGLQNFLVSFTLTQKSDITSFSLFTDKSYGNIGQAVTVRLRADVGGDTPSATNLQEIFTTIDAATVLDASNNLKMVTADFGPILLDPGTYWIGMSGSTSELGWEAFVLQHVTSMPPGQWQLNGETLAWRPNVYNFAYQIGGAPVTVTSGGVPEPASWALMICGIGLTGSMLRRRPTKESAAR
jgi:hypothetical protein